MAVRRRLKMIAIVLVIVLFLPLVVLIVFLAVQGTPVINLSDEGTFCSSGQVEFQFALSNTGKADGIATISFRVDSTEADSGDYLAPAGGLITNVRQVNLGGPCNPNSTYSMAITAVRRA